MKALRIWSMSILGGGSAICAVWAVIALLRGNYVTSLVATGIALFWFAPLLMWIIMPTVACRVTTDDGGTIIRPDRRIDVLLLVCLVVGTISLGVFGILGFLGRLDIPLPQDIAVLYTPIFITPSVICLVSIGFMARRGGIGFVRLTPDGFEFAEIYRTKRGKWEQVVAISDTAPERPQAKSPLVMRMTEGKDKILTESALYTPGGRALLAIMRFYWQHPEKRPELVDGRAADRIYGAQAHSGLGVAQSSELKNGMD